MARLNDAFESDNEFPKLSTILRPRTDAMIGTCAKNSKPEHSRMPSQIPETQDLVDDDVLTGRHTVAPATVSSVSPDKPRSRKQRPLGHLKQAHVNSLLLPVSDASISDPGNGRHQTREPTVSVSEGSGLKRSGKVTTDCSEFAQVPARSSIPLQHDDDSSTDLSGFIVPDSAGEGESLVPKSPKRKPSRTPKKISPANPRAPAFRVSRQPKSSTRQPSGMAHSIRLGEKGSSRSCLESPPMNESLRSEMVEARPSLDDHLLL